MLVGVLKQNFAVVSAQAGDHVQVGLEAGGWGNNQWHDTGCSNAGGAASNATAFTQRQGHASAKIDDAMQPLMIDRHCCCTVQQLTAG